VAKTQTMSHTVDSCPLTKLVNPEGNLISKSVFITMASTILNNSIVSISHNWAIVGACIKRWQSLRDSRALCSYGRDPDDISHWRLMQFDTDVWQFV